MAPLLQEFPPVAAGLLLGGSADPGIVNCSNFGVRALVRELPEVLPAPPPQLTLPAPPYPVALPEAHHVLPYIEQTPALNALPAPPPQLALPAPPNPVALPEAQAPASNAVLGAQSLMPHEVALPPTALTPASNALAGPQRPRKAITTTRGAKPMTREEWHMRQAEMQLIKPTLREKRKASSVLGAAPKRVQPEESQPSHEVVPLGADHQVQHSGQLALPAPPARLALPAPPAQLALPAPPQLGITGPAQAATSTSREAALLGARPRQLFPPTQRPFEASRPERNLRFSQTTNQLMSQRRPMSAYRGYPDYLKDDDKDDDVGSRSQSQYKCKPCGVQFTSTSALTKHKQHCDPRKYACIFCAVAFLNQGQLTAHMRNAHVTRTNVKISQYDRDMKRPSNRR